MGVVNLTKTLKGKTGWVSISADHKRVIAQAKSFKGLLAKLKKMGNPDGFIMIAARDFSSYIG
jgi:nickel-dependent lactate racemase